MARARVHFRRRHPGFATWALLISVIASTEAIAAPNIVLIVADDQRADTIAALGNRVIQTPHLDALAERGFVLRGAVNQGSFVPAVCVPSRAMMLSGQHLWQVARNSVAPQLSEPSCSVRGIALMSLANGTMVSRRSWLGFVQV